MSQSPHSSPEASPQKMHGKGQTAEQKLKEITDKIASIRLQRRQLSPDGKTKEKKTKNKKKSNKELVRPSSPATGSPEMINPESSQFSPGGFQKITREFYHPQLDYVIAEVAHSPYMVSPIENYNGDTLHLSQKIRNLKCLGKKSSELADHEWPCNFAEAKKIFTRVVNFKATFEGNSIDSNDRPAEDPHIRPKTPKHGKSVVLKASCARGGPRKYAQRIREIKAKRQKDGRPDEPYRLQLDPIKHSADRDSTALNTSPPKPGTKVDPYRSSPVVLSTAKSESEPALAQPSTGSASYGEDFEDNGAAPQAAEGTANSKEEESDGIYDDNDEDFESYTSKQIQEHTAKNATKSSSRPGASGNRQQSGSSMVPSAGSFKQPKGNGISNNGELSDLEDSIS